MCQIWWKIEQVWRKLLFFCSPNWQTVGILVAPIPWKSSVQKCCLGSCTLSSSSSLSWDCSAANATRGDKPDARWKLNGTPVRQFGSDLVLALSSHQLVWLGLAKGLAIVGNNWMSLKQNLQNYHLGSWFRAGGSHLQTRQRDWDWDGNKNLIML